MRRSKPGWVVAFVRLFPLALAGTSLACSNLVGFDGYVVVPPAEAWALRLGDGLPQAVNDLRAAPEGVVAAGQLQGTVDLGVVSMKADAGYDSGFLLWMDAAGLPRWARGFGSPSEDVRAFGVDVDAAGDIVVVGTFAGELQFDPSGPSHSPATTGEDDVFVAKFSASGGYLWSKSFGSEEAQIGTSVAFSPSGDVIVVGSFRSQLKDNDDVLLASQGEEDAFVLRLAGTTGTLVWAASVSGVFTQEATDVDVDGAGDVYVVGSGEGTMSCGGGVYAGVSGNQDDMFLVKLDGTDGKTLWAKAWGGTLNERARSVVAGVDGGVYVGGAIASQGIDFAGAGFLDSVELADAVVVRVGSQGTTEWVRSFGGLGDQETLGLALDPSGDVVASGYFQGSVDFGEGTVAAATETDPIFLVRLGIAGQTVWSHAYSAERGTRAPGLDVSASVGTALGGRFVGDLSFGADVLRSSGGGQDGFLARFFP